MKFGFLSVILGEWSFEEAVDIAENMGFGCMEVACWPGGTAERRYAGVSHVDAERVLVDEAYAEHITSYAAAHHITISSLAYYPNLLDPDPEKSKAAIDHLTALIRASARLGVGMVNTFIGRDQYKTVEENIELVRSIWPPIIALAEQLGVKIAIENCPMLFGPDQWPGGQNLMCSPVLFRKIFDVLPSPNLGLNFDPSHFAWLGLDTLRTIDEFRDRIFHIHFKDTKMDYAKLSECGIMAYPLDYMTPRIPGRGDIDWNAFLAALASIGYNGCAVIEVEDKDYEGSREAILESLRQSKQHLEQQEAFAALKE